MLNIFNFYYKLYDSNMNEYEKNEKFREACYLGDIDLVRRTIQEQKPDLNSANKVNGWTALHWFLNFNEQNYFY